MENKDNIYNFMGLFSLNFSNFFTNEFYIQKQI